MEWMIWMLLACLLGEDKLRVEGPPFLVLGEKADYTLETSLKNVTPVWRISGAPQGIAGSLESVPAYSDGDFTIRGVFKISLQSIGTTAGEARLSVSLERGGRRMARQEVILRIGKVKEVPVQIRMVEHGKGGGDPAAFEGKKLEKIQEEVNAIWKQCGIRFVFSRGEAVKGENRWFDKEGRFHPIFVDGGERKASSSTSALFRSEDPAAVDIFVVRDAFWKERAGGYKCVTIAHDLHGVGFKEGSVIIDDSANNVTIAHELGHVLGLDDLGGEARTVEAIPAESRRRLMCTVGRIRTGTAFTFQEMETARATALKVPAEEILRRR